MSSNLPRATRNLPPKKGVLVVERWQVGDNLGDNLDEAYSASISGFLCVGGRCGNFSKNLHAQDKRKRY
jgi:hypothetical protein